MKKLLILTALLAASGASVGCNCCSLRRQAECPPYGGDACDECQGGMGPTFGGPMGAPIITAPGEVITPGPAPTSAGYLPR